ncbi:MAG: lamin tail domain-containing protein [Alistipes sp.]|nr:lamin tail domain-containing protein [Alistipes sp.]
MKKILFAALALVALNSCVKDEMNPDALVPEKEPEVTVTYDYTKLVLNELSGAGEDNEKFFELYNTGSQDIDLEGVTINKDEELSWTGKKGQVIKAKGHFAIVGAKGTTPDGFSSGFSAKKSVIVELFAPEAKGGAKLDTFQRGEKGSAWGDQGLDNNKGSWSRIPDGSGSFMITPTATPGAANNEEGATYDYDLVGNGDVPEPAKEAKVVFNELCGNKAYDGNKFIELYNAGEAEGNLAGWTIRKYAADATDVAGKYNVVWTAPEATTLAVDAYLVLGADQTDPALGFNAGLSAKKGVKFELVNADGVVVDKFIRGADADPFEEAPLAENKEASFSRVPNGTGEWAYAAPTPGKANGEKTGDIEHE